MDVYPPILSASSRVPACSTRKYVCMYVHIPDAYLHTHTHARAHNTHAHAHAPRTGPVTLDRKEASRLVQGETQGITVLAKTFPHVV